MACSYDSARIIISLVVLVVLSLSSKSCCHSLGTFGLDIHHRFSDPVTQILGIHEDDQLLLPRKGTPQYYAAMIHRDRLFHGRRLAADQHTPITFAAGNETRRIAAFG